MARDDAYRIMGLPVGTDRESVNRAYEKFLRRTDPIRFPTGSSEQSEAARIRERIIEAYEILRPGFDDNDAAASPVPIHPYPPSAPAADAHPIPHEHQEAPSGQGS
jgi:hypothetical protein